MSVKSINLGWIIVKDFKKALQYYQDVIGLKPIEVNEEWGWAEFEGSEGSGMRLGIARQSPEGNEPFKPGQNTFLTFTVEDIEKANADFKKKGGELIGAIEEIPGHVKLQTGKDPEGNLFQFVQVISN